MISNMNEEACLGHGFFMCEIDSVHVYPVCWGYILAQYIPENFNDSEPGKRHFDFQPIYGFSFLSACKASRYIFITSHENQPISQEPVFDLDLKINHAFGTAQAVKSVLSDMVFSMPHRLSCENRWLCSVQRIPL